MAGHDAGEPKTKGGVVWSRGATTDWPGRGDLVQLEPRGPFTDQEGGQRARENQTWMGDDWKGDDWMGDDWMAFTRNLAH